MSVDWMGSTGPVNPPDLTRVDPKYRPVWEGLPLTAQAALARYFLPRHSAKPLLAPVRPRLIKWYCPFAHQAGFPSGHRYCINVYTGCSHDCTYCYAAAYMPDRAAPKKDFLRLLAADLADLEACDVPPAPVHLSNSTDPFQPLEDQWGHTRAALQGILEHRHRFSRVVVLTKDPLRAARLGCLDLFRQLAALPADHPHAGHFPSPHRPAFVLEVSLAFWRDEARVAYDGTAPTVRERIEGLQACQAAGIPVVLRIDPLFPRSPLDAAGTSLADLGLVETQTLADLDQLTALARELQVHRVVFSVAKLVQPRTRPLAETMRRMREAYARLAAPRKLVFRGASWRLPEDIASRAIVDPLRDRARAAGLPIYHCMANLLES